MNWACPESQPCLLTESICFSNSCTKRNRKNITEIMFETFRVPAFYLAMQAVLSLYSSGRIIGLMLDSGMLLLRVYQFMMVMLYDMPSHME